MSETRCLYWNSERADFVAPPSDRNYRELGEDIKQLATNLDTICEIVKNADAKWQAARRSRRTSSQKEWEFSSIHEIVGDYKATLLECRKLLDENPEFRNASGPLRNGEWNLIFRPKVEKLQKRLSAHNNKILLLLKPLELTLLSDVQRRLDDIHGDIADRIDAVHMSVMKLQGLIIHDVAQAIDETGTHEIALVEIPEHIESKFLEAAAKSRPEIRNLSSFPIRLGADSYVEHFDNSTKIFVAGRFLVNKTPDPEQYLNLLKCVWILKRIECSNAFRELDGGSTDSQWPNYIKQLHEDLNDECRRFSGPSTQKLFPPDMNFPFKDSQYGIWVEEDLTNFFSPHTQKVQPSVLQMPISKKSETSKRELIIHPVSQSLYRLIETIKDKTTPDKLIPPFEMDVDIEKFSFLPLYAIPSSSKNAFKIVLDSGSKSITPEFQEMKYLYRLQHLLTGYKVYERYDQAMVKVTCVISGQSEDIKEHGRIQLWLPEPFKRDTPVQQSANPSMVQQSANSSTLPNLESISSNLTVPGPAGRGLLSTETPIISRKPVPASLSSSSTNRSPNILSGGSIMTASASVSQSKTFTTINTGASTLVRVHTKPLKPLLVIFLKSKDQPTQHSIAAVEIDGSTSVLRERCQCRSSDTRCRISCIERKGGHLLAHRWDAHDKLTDWDLAKISTIQRGDTKANWGNLKRVSLDFQRWEGMLTSTSFLCALLTCIRSESVFRRSMRVYGCNRA